MKNLLIVLSLALVLFTFQSCTKEYYCNCDNCCNCDSTSNTSNTPNGDIDDAILYFPFNGDTQNESLINDDNDGTLYGGVSLTKDRFGTKNSSYQFNGSGYIEISNSNNLNYSEYSISLWVNFTKSQEGTIFCKHNVGGKTGGFSVGVLGNKMRYYAEGGTEEVISANNYNDGEWHHVVTVFADNVIFLYIDGNLEIESEALEPIFSTSSIRIGQTGGIGGYFYNGIVDDIRYYDKAISSTEIENLYNEK